MIQNKRFLHQQFKDLKISNYRFVVGIIIGVFYSISFYSFLYLVCEGFRLMSVDRYHDMWILSAPEVRFYNLFFAFLSVILGQSICFTYWIDKPKKFRSTLGRKRFSLLNDQRGLSWYFHSWFSKMAVVYGFMYGMYSWYYSFSFYPDYIYLFVLIIIVLFMQTWNNIRLIFKSKSNKWVLISLIITILFSLGLSRLNLIDYNKLNDSVLKKNINYNYKFDLVESDISQWPERLSLIEDVFVVLSKSDKTDTIPKIIINDKEFDLNNFTEVIIQLQDQRDVVDRRLLTFQIFIDKDIKMWFVNRLKFELTEINAYKLAYSVYPRDIGDFYPLSKNRYFPNSQRPIKYGNYSLYSIYEKSQKSKHIVHISNLKSESCTVNDSIVKYTDLEKHIKEYIFKHPDFIIELYVNNSASFESYFRVIHDNRKAINEPKDIYSMSKYSKKYDELWNIEYMNEVNKKYHSRLLELNDIIMEEFNKISQINKAHNNA